ncbi:alpha/beta hydrolase [Verrucomicrobiaceae bacterium 227]
MKRSIRAIFTSLTLAITTPLSAQEANPETIKLWPEGKAPLDAVTFENANATLTIFHPKKPNGTALVICPGGGYGRVVGGEGAPIAKWLNTHGITGIVLNYRLPQGNPYRPLSDVQQALRFTRAQASDWHLKPDRIGVIGFSAGGHLAAMAATKFTSGEATASDPVQQQSSRPDFAILVYPVITMGRDTHLGSRNNLLGPDPAEDLIHLYSNELQVTSKTPPTFLAHALDDRPVPPTNSEKFRDALLAKKVPAKYLPLASGGHGLNGYQGPMWDAWQTQSMQWLTSLFKNPK